MKKIILTIGIVLSLTAVNADCRKDTIYKRTVEDGINFNVKRIINQFSGNTTLVESIEQDWNTTTLKYDNYKKKSYNYHSSGALQEYIEQVWNSNNWQNWSKNTVQFNGNGKRTLALSQSWNKTSSIWVDQSKNLYNYDNNNNLISNYSYNWNYYGKSTWDLRYKDSMVYNGNNQEVKTIKYAFNPDDKTWENSYMYVQTYHVNGFKETVLELDWYQNKWDSSRIEFYTYNSKNLIELKLTKIWDLDFGKIDNSKENYSYNSADKILERKLQVWNPEDKTWENSTLTTHTYLNNTDEVKKSTLLFWNSTKNDYTQEEIEEYKCTFFSQIADLPDSKVGIYPNPINGNNFSILTATAQRLYMYNVAGKLLYSAMLESGENTVTLPDNIGNGMYHVRIGSTTQWLCINQ